MVLVGAAAKLLPFPPARLEKAIEAAFARKGEAVVAATMKAFRHGQDSNR
jgi:Pyruvate/2-oxoacid:ferredoxin oxidoreductase gamma subunit